MKIGVIIASTRPGRAADAINSWLNSRLKAHPGELEFSTIDLKEWDLPFYDEPGFPMSKDYQRQHTKDWSEEISRYDGFIIVTPEYNKALPATLKNAIDYLFHEWSFKPVAYVGYSSAGAFHAITNLRLIAAETNMVDIRRQIAINVWETVSEGEWVAGDKYDNEVETMLNQLEWWTKNLKAAREAGDMIV